MKLSINDVDITVKIGVIYLTDTIKTNNKQLKSSSQTVIKRKHPKKWLKFHKSLYILTLC